MPVTKRLVAVVERTYAAVHEGDRGRWIAAATEALAPLVDEGLGTLGYGYDACGPPRSWSITKPHIAGGPAELALAVTSTFAAAPESLLVPLYRASERVTTASAIQGFTFDQLEVGDAAAFSKKLGIVDLVSMHAGDPGGHGAIFAAGCAKRRTLTAAERWSLSRLASHLAAAHRLVTALSDLTPVATFDPTGRLLDATAHARRRVDPLRLAVRRIERARLRRTAPEDALRMWRALVEGRYSLVDRFESDGKRFVVAYENAPGSVDPRGLTEKERAVAGLLALGLPDKLIAYELGLGEGTVRAHAHAVFSKLGVKSRAAAVERLMPPSVAKMMRLGAAGPELVVFEDDVDNDVLAALSPAERVVAELAARGFTTRAIAARRKTAPGTIAKQLASAFAKLGVRSRAELALRRARPRAPS
jgi:DNA-binding NarL/FixJ family response regulator